MDTANTRSKSEPAGAYDAWLRKFDALPKHVQGAIAESLLKKSLELYIDPTEHCNFRCTYCYEDFKLGKMESSTVASLKRFIVRSMRGRTRLYLNWFGGEPLVAYDVILDIGAYALELCRGIGATLVGGITTNASLLIVPLLERLNALDHKFFQITFDGDRESHDAVRRRADGSGTFDMIWANLEAMQATELNYTVLLRLHLRPGNDAAVARLLEQMAALLGGDKRFHVAFHRLKNMGGTTGGTFDVLPSREFGCLEEELTARFKNRLFFGFGDDGESDGVAADPSPGVECGSSVCYACKPNSFLFRSDGRVGKCTVAMDKDYNTVGRLTAEGEIAWAGDRLQKWTRGMATLESGDLSCPYHKGDTYFVGR